MHWTTIERELRVFDDTKVGVKLLVDNGIVKIPQEFVIPIKLSSQTLCSGSAHLQIPEIDLKGIHEGGLRRKQIIEEIQHASETWGFFEIVNHGISEDVMNNQLKLKGSTTRET